MQIFAYMNKSIVKNISEADKLVLLAEELKTIAHPKRLQLIQLLGQKAAGKLSVTGIAGKLKISQPEASRHLLLMKNTGLLKSKKQKVNTYYFLNEDNDTINLLLNILTNKHD